MYYNFISDKQFTNEQIFELVNSNDDSNSSKELKKFPSTMTLSANLLKMHILDFCQTNISLTSSKFS